MMADCVVKKKPNRSRPRVFKPTDVGRIARYCRDDGSDPIEIIVHVVVSLGYRQFICVGLQVIKLAINIKEILLSVVGSTAGSAALTALITLLSRPYIKRIPYLSPFVVALLVLLINVKKVVETINESTELLLVAEQSVDDLELACKLSTIIRSD